MNTSIEVDIMSQAFKNDPYPTYDELRASGPAHRIAFADGQSAWLIVGYQAALDALKDPRLLKNFRNALTAEQLAMLPPDPEVGNQLSANMLDLDPPDHTRLRNLVHKGFTPRLIEHLRDDIQRLTDRLIDGFAARGEAEFIEEFAAILPMVIICDLLGIPEEDRRRFRHWIDAMIAGDNLTVAQEAQIAALTELVQYLLGLCERRRVEPRDDLISALLQVEDAGEMLDQGELLSMILLLLIAGHETTVNLLGNGMLSLLRHPDQLELLRRDPSLIKSAIEEMMRYESPTETATPRYAREPITIGDATIAQGEIVMAVLAAANRDPQQFDEPDRFDITRKNNKHLSFGFGIHYCLGAPLARLEAEIAFTTLLRRLPNLRLAADQETLRWRLNPILRGLEALPIAFDVAAE